MVVKKIEYRRNSFQVPVIPRAPRSVRRRGPYKRVAETDRICAFELLASLAGMLLQETESSSASSNASEGSEQPAYGANVDRREQNLFRLLEPQCIDQGSCEESVYVSELATQKIDQQCVKRGSARDDSDSNMECTSIVSNSDCSRKALFNEKPVNLEDKAVIGNLDCKLEGSFPVNGEHCISNVNKGIGNSLDVNKEGSVVLTNATPYSAKDKMVNMGISAKLAPTKSLLPDASFSKHRNDISLGSRDDDENFSRFSRPRSKSFRPAKRIGDRKMRKLLMSKYWKVAPKLKGSELSLPDKRLHNDGRWKAVHRKRKSCYNSDNLDIKHNNLHKRRICSDHSSSIMSDGGFSSESVSNSPVKSINGEKNGLAANINGVNGVSSSVTGHQLSFLSKTSNVRFSIKSFKVPELYIEVPESATVGLLKRTVREAVAALFGDGLRVGVLHQGKKIRDDNRTLIQAGFAHKGNLDALNFTLEPNSTQASLPVNSESNPLQLCESSQPLKRSATAPILDSGISDIPFEIPALSNGNNYSASCHESASHHVDLSTDKAVTDSLALVPVPHLSVEALAVVPINQKTRRSESGQRRTRRPFSVPEVEALVQAVEKLGTGRWRDVKLHAFEKADHRTYVDLKDKWKTLVHTANISPQQRRGEPVPQELLDRVLAAHAYWSQHQVKLHCKQQVGTLKNSEAHGDRNGVSGIALA